VVSVMEEVEKSRQSSRERYGRGDRRGGGGVNLAKYFVGTSGKKKGGDMS